MKKSFFISTLIALPLFASSAWAGGEGGSDDSPSTLHLVLRLRTPELDSNDHVVNPEMGFQVLSPQPFRNAFDSGDPILDKASDQSLILSLTPSPPNSDNELDEDNTIASPDDKLPTSPETSDKDDSIELTASPPKPEADSTRTIDPLLAEKERLRQQLADQKKANQHSQEEQDRRTHMRNTVSKEGTTIKKKKKKHKKGTFGQVSRFLGHLEKGKF